jgi:hypothetical protein
MFGWQYHLQDKVSNSSFKVAAIVKNQSHYNKQQTLSPESANELYQPSDRSLSAKLVPTFADRGVSSSKRGGSPMAVISVFYTRAATFSFK